MAQPPPLSRSWSPTAAQSPFYTGGKVHASSDGKTLTCWNAEDISIVSCAHGRVLRSVASHEDGFTAFCVDARDSCLVTSSQSCLLKTWDLETGVLRRQWKGHSLPVLDLCFDPSGTYFASGATDRTVRVWHADKGYATHSFRGHSSVVARVVFHPDVERLQLVSCAGDGEMRVWDLRAKKCVHVLTAHMSQVMGVAFSPDGSRMITGGRDKVVCIWNVDAGYQEVRTVPTHAAIETITFLPAPLNVASVLDKYAKRRAAQPAGGEVDPACDPNALHFATGGAAGIVQIWNAESGRPVHAFALTKDFLRPGQAASSDGDDRGELSRTITHLMLLPPNDEEQATHEEQLVAVMGSTTVSFFELSTMRRQKTFVGSNDEIVDLRCLPDGQHAVVATNSHLVRLFNLNTFNAEQLDGHTDIVIAVALSPDGRWLATGSKDKTVRLWSLPDLSSPDGRPLSMAESSKRMRKWKCRAVCKGHADTVSGVAFAASKGAFNPRVPQLAPFAMSVSRDLTLKRWDCGFLFDAAADTAALAEPIARSTIVAHSKDINVVTVSPNDKLAATGSHDKSIGLWDTSTLQLVARMQGHRRGVWSVEFSPVDLVLASSSGDKTVRIWSLSDYTCLRTLEGHTSPVTQAKFLNLGMQLMSADAEGVVKLWAIRTSDCVNTFSSGHTSKIWALDFVGADQRRMVTGGVDSVISIWDDVTQRELEEAASERANRTLLEQELSNAIRARDFAKAIKLAFELQHPRKLLNVFTSVVTEELQYAYANKASNEDANVDGDEDAQVWDKPPPTPLTQLVGDFTKEQLALCLRYARDWNTNARHAFVAQRLLSSIFDSFTPAAIVSSLDSRQQAREIVSALLVYSERHFTRTDRLAQQAYLVDYTLESMKLLAPQDEAGASSAAAAAGYGQLKLLDSSDDEDGDVPMNAFDVPDDADLGALLSKPLVGGRDPFAPRVPEPDMSAAAQNGDAPDMSSLASNWSGSWGDSDDEDGAKNAAPAQVDSEEEETVQETLTLEAKSRKRKAADAAEASSTSQAAAAAAGADTAAAPTRKKRKRRRKKKSKKT